ncbi:MAG TPA: tetratricopeptide repeat protein [Gemmataceae bacterium]|nr:tetratricopeptide repeat protein [Gemmataceae bacterium]
MPSEGDLANFPDLQPLLRRNSQRLRPDPDFDGDLERIIAYLKQFDSEEAIGATIADKYTLTAEIAQGGMGVVYLAEQRQPVKRSVAVKLIKPGMDSRDVLARFDAERQALAVMDHPNIAKVLDAGMTTVGRPFFVMEYVKGVPITQYCDEKKLTPQERLNLFIPVCNAVQHAHQKGIIHRDLKPSNVLVEVIDGKPVPKVIDFGLAKALGQKLTDKTLHTNLDIRIGTLEYSAPEQAAGRSFDVDTRSDIYSLGVLLYELLTGAPPFSREQLLKVGEEEMRRVIREDEPVKPSKRLSSSGELPAIAANRHLEPHKLTRLVQRDLDWIVMKCLEKESGRRYETANQLGQELQRFLAHEPVQAGPPSAVYRLRKFAQRHRAGLLATAAALLAVLLAAGGIGWAWWDRSAQKTAKRIELARRVADTESAVTIALTKAQQSEERAKQMPCTTSAEARASLAEWREAEAALAEAEAALATGAANDSLHEHVVEVRKRIARGRAQTQRKDNLFRGLDDARMALAAYSGSHFDYAGAAAKYAAAFTSYGLEIQSARSEELATLIGAEESSVRDALIVALDNWAFCAEKYFKMGPSKSVLLAIAQAADHDVWRRDYRQAFRQGDRVALMRLSKEARRIKLSPVSLNLLAVALYQNDQREEALDLLRWARGVHPADFWTTLNLGNFLGERKPETPLELEERIGCYRVAVALRPDDGIPHNNLGFALYGKKQLAEAIIEFNRSIALNPKFALAHSNLGLALHDQGQLDDAIAECKKAIVLDPNFALAHCNLGFFWFDKNNLDDALVECKKAVQLDPFLAVAHSNLGMVLYAKNLLDQAIVELKKAVNLDPNLAMAHSNLGIALRDKKQVDEAIAHCKKALALDPNLAQAHNNLGLALEDKGQIDEAVVECRKAIALDPKLEAAYNNLGNALADKGDLDAAIAEYQKALAIQPNSAQAHCNLGNALAAKKQFNDARAEYKKAVAINPRIAAIHFNFGNVLYANEQFDQAIVEYKTALEIDPSLSQARYKLFSAEADVRRAREKKEQEVAIDECKKAVALNANDPEAHRRFGDALRAAYRLDEAIAEYKKAIALDPKFAQAHYNHGQALAAKNQTGAAIAKYKKALSLDPKLTAAQRDLKTALDTQNQFERILDGYKNATLLKPNDAKAHYDFGNALLEQNRRDEAIAEYRKAVALDPKMREAHDHLAGALRDDGQLEEAIAEYKKAVALGASAHFSLALALKDNNQIDEAIAEYKKVIDSQPRFSGGPLYLGIALADNNQLDQAVAEIKKAVALDPEYAYSYLVLGKTYLRQRRFSEAEDSFKRCLKFQSAGDSERVATEQWMTLARRFVELENVLPSVLSRRTKLTDTAECLLFIKLCQFKEMNAAAARICAIALADQPTLANDREKRLQYNAACFAALAAAGEGKDANKLTGQERAEFRKQALQWLRTDLALWSKQLESEPEEVGPEVQREMTHWKQDGDLSGLRDMKSAEKLPPDERDAWQNLWKDVDALLAKAGK